MSLDRLAGHFKDCGESLGGLAGHFKDCDFYSV